MINILINILYFLLITYKCISGVIFPLNDPEAILCKRLKYGPKSLSTVEKNILERDQVTLFTRWYQQIRSRAIETSDLAKDCYIKTFSNQANSGYVIPEIIDAYNDVTKTSRNISVFPIQTNLQISRWELIKLDIKDYLFDSSCQILANMYDTSIFWGDGDGKPCGILNNDNVLEYSIVKCDTCDDIAGYELSTVIPKMLETISYPYRDDLKWYMNPELIDKIGNKISDDTHPIYNPDSSTLYGKDISASNIMPNNIRHPYPVLLANLSNAYCFVDKVDEFSISRIRQGNVINYVFKCNIGGEVLRPEAIVLLNTLKVSR